MNNINFQKETDKVIELVLKNGVTPTLLLHSCCAPCSSYVIEYLSQYFAITVFYYNPNIDDSDEYTYRKNEQIRFIKEFDTKYPVNFLDADYDTESFYQIAKGLEDEPERGKRCLKCFEMRLRRTAEMACSKGFDYFATTLTLSPLKDAFAINSIGKALGDKHNIKYLCSDFKKKNGYKRSIELSKEYNLYRQNYCGCSFSKNNKI